MVNNNRMKIISTEKDPNVRIESFALANLRGVFRKLILRINFLFRFYCELEMAIKNGNEQNRKSKNLEDQRNKILATISVLVNKAHSGVPTILTPSQILKTQKAFQEQSALLLTDFQSWMFGTVNDERREFLVDFMICYSLFQYWSLGINAAKSVLESLLLTVSSERAQDESNELQDVSVNFSGSKYHENVLLFYCRLLQFHSRNNICPVKPLRDLLLKCLSTFSESEFFLRSYVVLELKSCTSYSIRRYFDSVLGCSKTPVAWFFAILYERERQKTHQSIYLSKEVEKV